MPDDEPGQEQPAVVERVDTPRGELVLRRAGDHFEVISNGTFLMDTRSGGSERLLVRAALDALESAGPSVLIGGLGLGFSLAEACADDRVRLITVVEIERAVLHWHATHLRAVTGVALADPRVTVIEADLVEWLAREAATFDAICLDVDNGPEWTVTEANAALYGPEGVAMFARHLRPRGVLAVWSAAPAAGFEGVLRERFSGVAVHEVPSARGGPDVVYVASGARS